MEIGARIKKLRLELGLSQDELAKLVGYKSRSSINKIEIGERDITQSTIVAFAKALHTTPSKLMGWEEVEKVHTVSDLHSDIALSDHERKVIIAYRQNPDMQQAIDKLLGVEKTTLIYRAAKSSDNHPAEIIETTKDFSKIPPTKRKL